MAHKNRRNSSPLKSRQGSAHRKPESIFPIEEANDRLRDLFEQQGLSVSHAQRRKLAQFYVLLMEEQTRQNFTRLLTLREVGIKHFMDCSLVPVILANHQQHLKFPLLDMGTGPGFPGVPLKILFPTERILLAEGVQKRVEFLKTVRDQLELTPLDIIGKNVTPEFVYPVASVITRAVEDVQNTLGNVINCLRPGGEVVLMKGPQVDPELRAALSKWKDHYKLKLDAPYQIGKTSHRRRLLVFEKLGGQK